MTEQAAAAGKSDKKKRSALLGEHLLKAKSWDVRLNNKGEAMIVVAFDVPTNEDDDDGNPIPVHMERALVFGDSSAVRSYESLKHLGFKGSPRDIGSLAVGCGGVLDQEAGVTVDWQEAREYTDDNGKKQTVAAGPSIAWINAAGGIRMGKRISKEDAIAWGVKMGALIESMMSGNGSGSSASSGGSRPKTKPLPVGMGSSSAPPVVPAASAIDDDVLPF